MYYNGWQYGHYITKLFVFSACGIIISCVLNILGSVHDSTLAEWGGIYKLFEETYQRTGAMCCCHLVFASVNNTFIIKSSGNTEESETNMEFDQII